MKAANAAVAGAADRKSGYLARFSRDVGYRRASPLALSPQATVQGKTRGIPHLAKNERDMGHPAIVVGTEKTAKTLRSVHSILDLPTGKSATPLNDMACGNRPKPTQAKKAA